MEHLDLENLYEIVEDIFLKAYAEGKEAGANGIHINPQAVLKTFLTCEDELLEKIKNINNPTTPDLH